MNLRLGWWAIGLAAAAAIFWWGREPDAVAVRAEPSPKIVVESSRPSGSQRIVRVTDAQHRSIAANPVEQPSPAEPTSGTSLARPAVPAALEEIAGDEKATAAKPPSPATQKSAPDRNPDRNPDPSPDPANSRSLKTAPVEISLPPGVVSDLLVEAEARKPPVGTAPKVAKAYERIPQSRGDRAPLGDIAETGAHVDRFNLGTEFDRGQCRGSPSGYSPATHKYVHFCFRVVHQRRVEYVIVKWEHEGQVLRRALIRIPADHAYRTRAGLSLRKAKPGAWRVSVVSSGGVQLASTTFDIAG